MSADARTCTLKFKVPFYDVDPMQVLWHGNYLKYFEVARAALFESLGVDLYKFHESSGYVFPITKSQIKHIRPLKLGEEFLCTALLTECKRKLVVDFEIRLASDNSLCTRGRTEQVAVKLPDMEMDLVIPDALQEALNNWR